MRASDRTAAVDAAAAADVAGPDRAHEALPHRLDWWRATAGSRACWLEVRDSRQRSVAGFGVSVAPTRVLPGHRLLRVERLRFAPNPAAAAAAVRYLMDEVRRDHATLSLVIEPFFADDAEKALALDALAGAGLSRIERSRTYTHTVRIGLAPSPEALLAGFHANARRHIRAVGKRPVAMRLVDSSAFAPRLDAILGETFERTAGPAPAEPWPEIIEYARAHPQLARFVSLVRTDRDGPDALVAFALGLNHGDHVEYSVAGSARPPDLRMPFGYALAWDLMQWARTVGAAWFDFGGIAPHAIPGDERQGIHEFKLNFGSDVVEVSQTWGFTAKPARLAWVRAAARLAASARGFGRSTP